MQPLIIPPKLDRTLLHITQAEAEEPFQVIADFCDEYTPGQVRDNLEAATKIAMIHDERNNLAGTREDFQLWVDRTTRLVEAVFALRQIFQLHPDLAQLIRA